MRHSLYDPIDHGCSFSKYLLIVANDSMPGIMPSAEGREMNVSLYLSSLKERQNLGQKFVHGAERAWRSSCYSAFGNNHNPRFATRYAYG